MKDTDTDIDPAALENVEPSDIQIDTLAGDIRDHVIDLYKQMRTPWPLLAEEKQHDLANGADQLAKEIVRRVVRLVTAHDFPRVVVRAGDLKISGGDKQMEMKVTAGNVGDNLDILSRLPGQAQDGAEGGGDADDAADDEPPHDPETGEVATETDVSAGEPTPVKTTKGEDEHHWLSILAKLRDGEAASIPAGVAARLIEKGFVKQVTPKKGANPARYAATPAGRHAVDDSDEEAA